MTKALVPFTLSRWDVENHVLANTMVISAAVALLALAAQVNIPLPGSPIPLTGQTFAVLVIGASLGTWRGTVSTLLYLLGGGFGLPFLAGGGAGWHHFTGVTGGYLMGFVLAAALMGFLCEKGMDQRVRTAWPLFYIGHAVIFLCGVSWLALYVGWQNAFLTGFLPFLPGEVLKTTMAALFVPAVRKSL